MLGQASVSECKLSIDLFVEWDLIYRFYKDRSVINVKQHGVSKKNYLKQTKETLTETTKKRKDRTSEQTILVSCCLKWTQTAEISKLVQMKIK